VATDAQGNVDLTAFQAQLLIQQHQSIDGLDAPALAQSLADSPAMGRPDGRDQLEPMLQALGRQLPPQDAERLAQALDANNLTDSRLERNWELLTEAAGDALDAGRQVLDRTDASISDSLAQARRWAEQIRDNPENSYLQRSAGHVAGGAAEKAQEGYGMVKGAAGHGLQTLGDTVDLATFTVRFSHDRDFRNMIIGAAGMYAAEAWDDPSKPVDDVTRIAKGAWDEWKQGLDQAEREGKAAEYMGQAEGAAGVEILATLVPVSKLPKLAKVAKAADMVDDGVPLQTGGVGRKLTREGVDVLTEVGDDFRRAQARGGVAAESADLMFDGLAGVRRSQGELRDLVDGLRQTGHVDELLKSGALRPRELGYLARQNVDDFKNVPFDHALTASVGGRELAKLGRPETGEIGEAIMAHDLAKKGYRDIVPIQNNSGHGNDLVAINPDSNKWEIFEVKASVKGIAKGQGPDPQPLVSRRIELAAEAAPGTHWDPKNMWEEAARPTAERIREETVDAKGRMQVDTYWSRINLEQDPATGLIKGEPKVEPWLPKAERPNRQSLLEESMPVPGLQLPDSLKDPAHPGHSNFLLAQDAVYRMEFANKIPAGPHSEQLAAAVATRAETEGLRLASIQLKQGVGGQLDIIERGAYDAPERRVVLDTQHALGCSVEEHSRDWSAARSPHYVSQEAAAERTQEHMQVLQQLSGNDRALFDRIRDRVPAQIGDDRVLQAMVQARDTAGIDRPERLGAVEIRGDQLSVVSNSTARFRANVDLSGQAPSMHESLDQNNSLTQQLAQQQTLEAQQREQREQQGQVMQMG
ncbi:XVIPCD domain-containing protein, partial [Marilutibacter maris]|uniref:XVIPCD domain-containing protein n=1 Tax=Marilutibacter maris TaxID=1605891 RepID=UPI0014786A21